eukprot:m.123100 g.123100  ORF g.123100 m.123100 type:complete len:68 (-) comp52141_c0_seq11:59-262(-)
MDTDELENAAQLRLVEEQLAGMRREVLEPVERVEVLPNNPFAPSARAGSISHDLTVLLVFLDCSLEC